MKMKKCLAVILALCCFLMLTSCSSGITTPGKRVFRGISSAVKIQIVLHGEGTVVVTDPDAISHICDNLLSLKLSRLIFLRGMVFKPSISVCRFTFYDENDKTIATIDYDSNRWISCDDSGSYIIKEGGIDFAFIKTLFPAE